MMKKMFRIAVMLTCWVGTRVCAAQEIDRLLAAVNGKVITRLDLQLTRTLNAVLDLGQNKEAQSEKQQLDQLVDQELIRQEMEVYSVSQAQVDEVVQSRIENLKKAYAEIGGLPALLRQLGLESDELTNRVKIIVLAERFIDLRFGPFVTVSPEEVESYYRQKLIPQLKAKGNPIPSLREVAAMIEALLKENKKTEAWSQWMDNIKKSSRIEYFDSASDTGIKKRP